MTLETGVGAGEGMAWASKTTHASNLLHLDYIPKSRGGDKSTEVRLRAKAVGPAEGPRGGRPRLMCVAPQALSAEHQKLIADTPVPMQRHLH